MATDRTKRSKSKRGDHGELKRALEEKKSGLEMLDVSE